MKRYLLIEQGEYSDYGVSIVDVTNCPLKDKEVAFLLAIDAWDKPQISGEIRGEIELNDLCSIHIKDIKQEAESHIDGLFCCYNNRPVKTILERLHTKEECLNAALKNDGSGLDYWQREVDEKYEQYVKGFKLIQKLQ